MDNIFFFFVFFVSFVVINILCNCGSTALSIPWIKMKLESLSLQDGFDILYEKRCSDGSELGYNSTHSYKLPLVRGVVTLRQRFTRYLAEIPIRGAYDPGVSMKDRAWIRKERG